MTIASSIGAAASPSAETPTPTGKRVTLLHFTDSHAQIETHPDYLPGASPEFRTRPCRVC